LDAENYGKRLGDLLRSVFAHHPAALDPPELDPYDSTAEKADHRRLLPVCEQLGVGLPCVAIDSEHGPALANASGAVPLPIACDAAAHLLEPGQQLDVDV